MKGRGGCSGKGRWRGRELVLIFEEEEGRNVIKYKPCILGYSVSVYATHKWQILHLENDAAFLSFVFVLSFKQFPPYQSGHWSPFLIQQYNKPSIFPPFPLPSFSPLPLIYLPLFFPSLSLPPSFPLFPSFSSLIPSLFPSFSSLPLIYQCLIFFLNSNVSPSTFSFLLPPFSILNLNISVPFLSPFFSPLSYLFFIPLLFMFFPHFTFPSFFFPCLPNIYSPSFPPHLPHPSIPPDLLPPINLYQVVFKGSKPY